jgi:prevent-host-death family protein
MKTVNVADLKNRLSSYLQMVRRGEEVIVKDRDQPIARITPYPQIELSDQERQLVAAGVLKLPEENTTDWDEFWEEFWALPSADLDMKTAMRAVLEEREEGW